MSHTKDHAQLSEQFNKDDAEKAADKTEDLLAPDTTADKGAYHFKRNFWNNEVLGNVEGVLTVIAQALEAEPTPYPSRKREGE